jgi:hypothetical protein
MPNDPEYRRRKYEGVSENALLKGGARLVALIGIPVAGFLFLQVWNGQESLQKTMIDVGKAVAVIANKTENNTGDIAEHSERLQYIERQLWTNN